MVAALSHVSIRPIVDSVTGSVAETRFETPQQGICSGVRRTTGEARVLPFGPPRALCFKRKKHHISITYVQSIINAYLSK